MPPGGLSLARAREKDEGVAVGVQSWASSRSAMRVETMSLLFTSLNDLMANGPEDYFAVNPKI
jgi:hypothetical protein